MQLSTILTTVTLSEPLAIAALPCLLTAANLPSLMKRTTIPATPPGRRQPVTAGPEYVVPDIATGDEEGFEAPEDEDPLLEGFSEYYFGSESDSESEVQSESQADFGAVNDAAELMPYTTLQELPWIEQDGKLTTRWAEMPDDPAILDRIIMFDDIVSRYAEFHPTDGAGHGYWQVPLRIARRLTEQFMAHELPAMVDDAGKMVGDLNLSGEVEEAGAAPDSGNAVEENILTEISGGAQAEGAAQAVEETVSNGGSILEEFEPVVNVLADLLR